MIGREIGSPDRGSIQLGIQERSRAALTRAQASKESTRSRHSKPPPPGGAPPGTAPNLCNPRNARNLLGRLEATHDVNCR